MNPTTLARARDITAIVKDSIKAFAQLGWALIPYAITASILIVGIGAGKLLAAMVNLQVAK